MNNDIETAIEQDKKDPMVGFTDNSVMWNPGMTMYEMEKQVLLAAVRFHRGNKTAAAMSLGLSARTVYNKLDSYLDDVKREELRQIKSDQDRRDFDRKQRGFATSIDGRIELDPQISRVNTSSGPGFVRQNQPAEVVGSTKAAEPNRQGPNEGNGTTAGNAVEPVVGITPQHAMSLPVGKEVQELPSQQAARGNTGRNRR